MKAAFTYLELPLEQLYRRRGAADQLAFAREALGSMPRRHDLGALASPLGLHLFARDEEALHAASATLAAAYGEALEPQPPKARTVSGVRTEEPIMHVGINAAERHRRAVRRAMMRRGAKRLRTRDRFWALLLYEAPLAELLGFGAELDGLTGGSVLHWMSLSRYASVERSAGTLSWEPLAARRGAVCEPAGALIVAA